MSVHAVTSPRSSAFRQGAEHTLFVEGSSQDTLDPVVLSDLQRPLDFAVNAKQGHQAKRVFARELLGQGLPAQPQDFRDLYDLLKAARAG